MTGPVCAVVGVGPGNGAAIARRFSAAGYRIALLARSRETGDALAAELAGSRAYSCDATQAQDLIGAFARIAQELGPVDALIYNAGSAAFGNLDQTKPEAMEAAWRVNTLGCLVAAQQVVPAMRKARAGKIIVMGATAALRGGANFAAFASAKAAQRSLAQSMARQLAPEGIHVAYVIIDGVIDIPRTRAFLKDKPDEFFLKPTDIADSVFHVASQPRSAWTFELDLRPFGEKW
jgi:NADP-dependent 3-hydroxy acid dehydrogenase YdfG